MPKNILFVGDGNHQFILNLVLWLKKHKNIYFQIDILSYNPVRKENRDYFDNIYSIEDYNWGYPLMKKMWGLRQFYRFFLYNKLLKKLPEYDFVHFHFIDADSYFLSGRFKKTVGSKIIFSIWGSDLYRVGKNDEKKFFSACQHADLLTFTNRQALQFFKDNYEWQTNNLLICRFGLAPLEALKEFSVSKSESKNVMGWDGDKLAVVIGYNLSPAQQHLEILSSFKHEKLRKFKDKIQLIVPLTYQGTEKYKNQILEKLNQLPYKYKVYADFMTDGEVAHLRNASDVMIQLQTTDQLSGSMQEHLFAENIVITGSWLPYQTLKEEGAWFIEVDKVDELVTVLPAVLENYKEYAPKTVNSSKAIAKLSLWDQNIDSWIALYK